MSPREEARYLVFGSGNFAGNPATLFELDSLEDTAALASIAEASASEDNVFYCRDTERVVLVRFFSRHGELLLCGHGLLALGEHLLRRRAGSSPLTVLSPAGSYRLLEQEARIWASLPAFEAIPVLDPGHALAEALRQAGLDFLQLYACPNEVWIALLDSVSSLRAADARAIAELAAREPRLGALILTVRLSAQDYAFRYFAPRYGKPEDSGTGSAQCYLAPLFLDRNGATGRALQYSPGGTAEMQVQRDADAIRIGGAVTADSGQRRC